MGDDGLTRAERNIAWGERYIRIPEGKFVGQQLVMADFMKDDVQFQKMSGVLSTLIPALNTENDMQYRGMEIEADTP